MAAVGPPLGGVYGTQDAGASAQALLPSIPVLPQFGFQTSKLPPFCLSQSELGFWTWQENSEE